jgi:hypothetical protein
LHPTVVYYSLERIEIVRTYASLSQNASKCSGGNLVVFRNNRRACTRGCDFDDLMWLPVWPDSEKPAASSLRLTSRNGSGFMLL